MSPSAKKLLDRARAFFSGLSRQARFALSLAATLSLAGLLYLGIVDRTVWVPLFTGLATEDAASIVEELKKTKIVFKLQAGGTTVMVPEEHVHETRLSLASRGLPKGGGVGFEIFDTQKFGISDFAQQVNYRRALQGELERTISQLDSVRSARVHIALPKSQLFVGQKQPASAAVTLRLHPGRSLSRSAVKAVVHLVSSAVTGLGPEDVTVVDTSGVVHWAGTEGSSGATGLVDQRQQLEESLERRLREILEAALGPGRSVVKVTAQVAMTQTEQMDEEYDPEKTAVRSESSLEEQDEKKSTTAAGIPGVRGNLPGGPSPSTGGSRGGNHVKRLTRNFEVNKTIRKRVIPAGELERLSVAVLVDSQSTSLAPTKGPAGKTAPPRVTLAALEEVVKKAVGYAPKRGDLVTLQSVPFAVESAAEESPIMRFVTETLNGRSLWTALGILGALVAAMILMRTLRQGKQSQLQREVEVIDLPRTVQEIEKHGTPAATLEAPRGAQPALAPPEPKKAAERELAVAAARHDALRSAAVLRSWMSGS
jgi:flagellar M-ring protein FliF